MGNWVIEHLKYIASCILELIYSGEEECIICSEISEERCLCDACMSKLRLCKGIFTLRNNNINFHFYSAAYYSYVMMELIIRLKYKSDFRCGELIVSLMEDLIRKEDIDFDILTFVPSRAEAYKKRGYNQSEYLAVSLGRIFHKKVYTLLEKVTFTSDQIGLDSSSRWENLSNSFKAKNYNKITNNKILLVDDVITTGATAYFCAKELNRVGAIDVIILTAAKSKI